MAGSTPETTYSAPAGAQQRARRPPRRPHHHRHVELAHDRGHRHPGEQHRQLRQPAVGFDRSQPERVRLLGGGYARLRRPHQLALDSTNTDGGSRTIDYALNVASPTLCGIGAPCVADAQAAPLGPARFCLGGTSDLDASGSTLTGCSGTAVYQWFQGGNPLAGATAATYSIPTSLAAGAYSYTVQVSCSTQAGCSDLSAPLPTQIDPLPLVVNLLKGKKVAPSNVYFEWLQENTAVGGYRIYRTSNPTLIPVAHAGTAGVSLAASTAPNPRRYPRPSSATCRQR